MPPKVVEAPVVEPDDEEAAEPVVEEEPTEITLSTGLTIRLMDRHVEEIWAQGDDHEEQSKSLTRLMGLEDAYGEFQRDLVADFCLYNLLHAKSICLTARQGSVFHAIMEQTLQLARSKPARTSAAKPQDIFTASECFGSFEKLIIAHSEPAAEPDRLGIFSGSQARLLTDFASLTLFKHYLLYQYCLTTGFEREVQALRFCVEIERPLPPPNLIEGKEVQRRDKPGSGGTDQAGPLDNEQEEEELTEEQEIERMVQMKLKDVEAKLHQKIEARKTDFEEKLAQVEEEAKLANAKGKKK